MAGEIGMIVIIILCAVIAKLLRRIWVAVVLVILVGAMLAQGPANLGGWTSATADFVLGIPAWATGLVEG